MTLFRHRTCTYLHGRTDIFLVSVYNGQVAAPSDWAYYQWALIRLFETNKWYFVVVFYIVNHTTVTMYNLPTTSCPIDISCRNSCVIRKRVIPYKIIKCPVR